MSEEDKVFKLPLLKKIQRTQDAYSFFFDKTAFDPSTSERKTLPDFKPGAMLELHLNIDNPDERGDTRVFTICSSPTESDFYMFTTRIIQSSFKKTLLSLNPGDNVEFKGPWADIEFDESPEIQRVFLSGGIGITPFRSMVTYMKDKKLNIPTTLFASFSVPDEVVFIDEMNEAERVLSEFKSVYTVTRPEESGTDWDGEAGRINEDMIRKNISDLNKSIFYVVGPAGFNKGMREMLYGLNIEEKNIVVEDFPGYS